MKKLLGREPTPEILSAIHGAICGEYNEEGFYNAIYNAAPPMPEPGAVEKELRSLAKHPLDTYTIAADLIAALQFQRESEGPLIESLRHRAEKAEAEREKMFRQLQHWWKRVADLEAERDAYQATADHHYSEAFKFKAECERLLKLVVRAADFCDYSTEEKNECGIRECCGTIEYKDHAPNCEFKAAIDTAMKPRSDADVLTVYFEEKK